MAVDNSDRAGL